MNGTFQKAAITLVVAGILGNFGFAWNTNARIAVLCREIEALQMTKVVVQDLQVAMQGVKENHKTMKDEGVDLRKRLRDVERRIWQGPRPPEPNEHD